jgi:hypothetical protein
VGAGPPEQPDAHGEVDERGPDRVVGPAVDGGDEAAAEREEAGRAHPLGQGEQERELEPDPADPEALGDAIDADRQQARHAAADDDAQERGGEPRSRPPREAEAGEAAHPEPGQEHEVEAHRRPPEGGAEGIGQEVERVDEGGVHPLGPGEQGRVHREGVALPQRRPPAPEVRDPLGLG